LLLEDEALIKSDYDPTVHCTIAGTLNLKTQDFQGGSMADAEYLGGESLHNFEMAEMFLSGAYDPATTAQGLAYLAKGLKYGLLRIAKEIATVKQQQASLLASKVLR
jgi:hypothetical protein